ncbi:OmpW/AlkL family protein [Celerinatantimonas diazotrophica]|uniref:Outer membrane protein n=1 Tax=Celerinatantimonas diazotrophica TaxID=412034 RepID=A0A4R1JAN1_9GAMM|nr:OmpW family outer membrane protein [Celerinatantimonas diazotrophica]TCK47600.1 outer membrane protein [Celerinatantimonas diazotrophica]CAG9296777.1 Outer membrane protein W [Celerinatantimonas diazotrophica]
MKFNVCPSWMALTVISASLLAVSTANAATFKPKSAGDILIRARVVDVVPEENITGSIPGSADLNNDVIPELDFSYFFTDHIAAELIAGTSKHDLKWTGNTDLGSVRLLPPTLTLQYHFMPKQRFSPYVGAGINYTHFYAEDTGSANSSIDYKDKFGYALQAGFDYAIAGNWSFNVDVKKIFLRTDVHTTVGSTHVTASGHINPWLLGVGVGYRF